jgi:hypothetical protein
MCAGRNKHSQSLTRTSAGMSAHAGQQPSLDGPPASRSMLNTPRRVPIPSAHPPSNATREPRLTTRRPLALAHRLCVASTHMGTCATPTLASLTCCSYARSMRQPCRRIALVARTNFVVMARGLAEHFRPNAPTYTSSCDPHASSPRAAAGMLTPRRSPWSTTARTRS